MEKEDKIFIALAGLVIVFVLISLLGFGSAITSGNSDAANLTIFDATDSEGGGENRFSNMNITFFANFSNSTGTVINKTVGSGNCQVRFNVTGTYDSFTNSSFNGSSLFWNYNISFARKGVHLFQYNCTSIFGNLTVTDSFTISNTAPAIDLDQGNNYIDYDSNGLNNDYWQCTEDTLCIYNFSNNLTDIDLNDVLTYINLSANTTLNNFTLNITTGILEINATNDGNAGTSQIRLQVEDSDGATDAGILQVNITANNDAPTFENIDNKTFNISSLFEFVILATDEEGDTPYTFNITFISCSTAEWSYRNSSQCDLFNSTQYSTNATALNISFTPNRGDVGNYSINFTVTDLNNIVNPYNASTSIFVNFTVININENPLFYYVCDNERSATEGTEHTCRINVTDNDETKNLSFFSNLTWFLNFSSVNVNTSTNYNGSIFLNFTPDDLNVGNWSVVVYVNDTNMGQNTSSFYFFVDYVNDSVYLDDIPNVSAVTSNNYSIFINASDNDLLIPSKDIYNESLSFSSNVSWVHISIFARISNKNITAANITFNPNDGITGNQSVNITVRDENNFSIHSKVFRIQITGNDAPIWNETTVTNYTLTEDTNFVLNLSQNVTDQNGDTLNFSYSNTTSFANFNINTDTGIIDFTPSDDDIGEHIIDIIANDGLTTVSLEFNFTVRNIADEPYFETPITVTNASVDSNSNVNASEDNYTTIEVYIRDGDFRIPSGQKGFYDENLTLNLNIVGLNSLLFSFSKDSSFPAASGNNANRSRYSATFTPNKSDVGYYNITLNVTDNSNTSVLFYFNLSISSLGHAPNLISTGNVSFSINDELYLDFNATDLEDINDTNSWGNITFFITNLTAAGNLLTINSSNGIINVTLNASFAGKWDFNVSINDSDGEVDFEVFTLTVYDYPSVLSPSLDSYFSFVENLSSVMNFSVNHTVGDNLNYSLYLNGALRDSILDSGNGTYFAWNFTANFSDETTCIGQLNLTINVSNGKLSNSTTYNLTINHTDSPVSFDANVGGGDSRDSGNSPVSLTLSDYFSDIDATDTCYNQSIGFIWTEIDSSATVTVASRNWTDSSVSPTINFSSSDDASANYSITAYEYNSSDSSQLLRNASSNNFTIVLSVSTSTTTSPSTGGGGGSTKIKPISLKFILPDPIKSKKQDKFDVSIQVLNDGSGDLKGIDLSNTLLLNNQEVDGIKVSLSTLRISTLKIGESVNLDLGIDVDVEENGIYGIVLKGSASEPIYSNTGTLYVDVTDEKLELDERILFTEEFIADNPECFEVRELVTEAKRLYDSGDLIGAEDKLDEALDACKRAIEQPPSFSPEIRSFIESILDYTLIGSAASVALGFMLYYFIRWRVRRNSAKAVIKAQMMEYKIGS
jgi:hypothetical protein